MVFETGKTGSVRLTLKVIKSGNKPFILVYPSEGVEKIMGKHSQMGIFGPDAYATLECLAAL
jgi:hypothetical protein